MKIPNGLCRDPGSSTIQKPAGDNGGRRADGQLTFEQPEFGDLGWGDDRAGDGQQADRGAENSAEFFAGFPGAGEHI